MHVLLIPIGSHGDVHPFVGLGVALRARGHRATLITNEHFAPLAAAAGLEFRPLGSEAEFTRAINNPDLWQPMKGFRLVMEMLCQLTKPLHDLLREYSGLNDTVLAAQVTAFGARVAFDSLRLPLVTVHLQPSVFMSTLDPPELPLAGLMRRLPQWGRRALLKFTGRTAVDPLIAPSVNAVLAEAKLKPVRDIMHWWHSPQSLLCLFPDWYAPPQADWPPNVHLTGFPLFDEGTHRTLDPAVTRFLSEGPSPVVFTAGSAMQHGHEFFQAATDACAQLGRRGILLARFRDQIPRNLPESVRHFDYVPFTQLLPSAAALVHHGGIGTTAQALAAGIPQLVMPMAHDQPDNAMRLERLGVGERLVPKRFKAANVAAKLGALLDDPDVSARARRLAERIRNQDALNEACEVIEQAIVSPERHNRAASAPAQLS